MLRNCLSVKRKDQMRNSRGGKRVLVVEDEPIIGRVCAETLTEDGLEVDVATNGSVAVTMIDEKEYDLLLVDIRTPMMNGKQLFQWITEKHPELANRVILTTGESFGSASEEFIEQSGRPFLPKPFTPDILIATVREAMSTRGSDAEKTQSTNRR